MISLSIIFSFRNEEDNIKELIKRVYNSLKNFNGLNWELIFINDSSTDRSSQIINQEARKLKIKTSIFTTSRRFGVTPCVLFGISKAKTDYIVYLDSDLQDPPELIPSMLKKALENKLDVIHTIRSKRLGENHLKMLITRMAYILINKLSDIDLKNNAGDFKLLSRRAYESVLLNRDKDPYMRGLVASVGFNMDYLTYEREERFAGEKKFSLFSSLNPYRELIRAITLHSDIPLFFAATISLIGILISLVSIIISLIMKLNGMIVDGVTFPIIVVSLLFCIVLISLFIIDLYLVRILSETRNKKDVLVRNVEFLNKND